jgi:hypothetical protein
MATMDDAVATPRQEAAYVTAATLARAEALVAAGQLRDAAVAVLADAHSQAAQATPAMQATAHTSAQPSEQTLLPALVGVSTAASAAAALVDGGGLVHRAMLRLRAEPWAMLSLDASVAVSTEDDLQWDKAVRGAFKTLALALHPDKSRWPSDALFACLYASYERLKNTDRRAAWRAQRADEARARKAAHASGGSAATEAFEVRQAKERVRLERELLRQWRATQQGTFSRWVADDVQQATALAARDKDDRTRQKQDLARTHRRLTQHAARAAKREDMQRLQSSKLQRALEAQAKGARSAMAALEAERQTLEAARALARAAKEGAAVVGVGSGKPATRGGGEAAKKALASDAKTSSGRKPPSTAAAPEKTDACTEAAKARRRPRPGALPPLPGAAAPEDDDDDNAPKSWQLVAALFARRGPLGFTLTDTSAPHGAQKGGARATRDDGGYVAWAAEVLRLDDDGAVGRSAAGAQGVRAGDLLVAVNGHDLKGVRFTELCAFLEAAPFPRKLEFRRRCE